MAFFGIKIKFIILKSIDNRKSCVSFFLISHKLNTFRGLGFSLSFENLALKYLFSFLLHCPVLGQFLQSLHSLQFQLFQPFRHPFDCIVRVVGVRRSPLDVPTAGQPLAAFGQAGQSLVSLSTKLLDRVGVQSSGHLPKTQNNHLLHQCMLSAQQNR